MNEIKKYFPDIGKKQFEQFAELEVLYGEWNEKINVISRKDFDQFYIRHVLHSLAIAKLIAFKSGSKILDVGTGGGFPGIPLAIYFPTVQFHLVDSIGKKIKVVQEVAKSLGLRNVVAEQNRVENLTGQYDFVVSRAVTQIDRFLPWMKGKVRTKSQHQMKNGFLFLKGGDLDVEFKNQRGRYKVYPISDYFEYEFFETKKIVYMQSMR